MTLAHGTARRNPGLVRSHRRPGTRDQPEMIDTTPMLVSWTMALIISFIATMAITNIVALNDVTIVGTLTAISAAARVGIVALVRH